ncbi:hypothetical protein PLICRDRAFT_42391 [Plicaturopsis crispa FD-325 SS-3]|nr:hypothetical protein PLICRDRAFT_42391 [Plicaturopsis crispa FD-325 SS-3]
MPRVEIYTGQRCTYTTSKPFDEVIASIRTSVHTGESFMSVVEGGTPRSGLFLITEYDHGKWYRILKPAAPRIHKFVMGNPFALARIMRQDVAACLHAPLDFLVIEIDSGTTEIVFDLPSSMMASARGGEALAEAARISDEKVKEAVAGWL